MHNKGGLKMDPLPNATLAIIKHMQDHDGHNVMLSVGGASAEEKQWQTVQVEKFTNQLMDFVLTHNLDGVDFDYESTTMLNCNKTWQSCDDSCCGMTLSPPQDAMHRIPLVLKSIITEFASVGRI